MGPQLLVSVMASIRPSRKNRAHYFKFDINCSYYMYDKKITLWASYMPRF